MITVSSNGSVQLCVAAVTHCCPSSELSACSDGVAVVSNAVVESSVGAIVVSSVVASVVVSVSG